MNKITQNLEILNSELNPLSEKRKKKYYASSLSDENR